MLFEIAATILLFVTESFDIPARIFDFKADLKYGKQGEELISQFLNSLSGGDFEVKSDRYRNGRMVIETQQNPRGAIDADGKQIWVDSGINVTTAKWWVYIYSPDGAFVVIDVARLKRYLRLNPYKFNENTKRSFGGSDNPAKGYLIYPNDVVDLITNQRYDEVGN